MNMKQVRAKARELRVANYSRLRKVDLIQAVQRAEGNDDCFRRIPECGQVDCCWHGDCQSGA